MDRVKRLGGLVAAGHLPTSRLRRGAARAVFASLGLLAIIVAAEPSSAAQQCMTVTDLSCASGFQGCPTGFRSMGCRDSRRTCCRDTGGNPAPPNTGGGSLGGNPPALAGCLVGGVMRRDIIPADCPEAQRTGCIRRLLSEDQYAACLRAQPVASGRGCVVAGVLRKDIARTDCREAPATGCIRRLLTAEQYKNCLAAQKR